MRKIYSRSSLRHIRRNNKWCSLLISISFILLCFVYIIYENRSVIEISNQEIFDGHSFEYGKLPTELNSLDLSASRRHNRNLQHLYLDEKGNSKLSSMIYKRGRNRMKGEVEYVSLQGRRGVFNVPKKTVTEKEMDTPSNEELNDYYNLEGYRTSSDESIELKSIQKPTKKLPTAIIIGVKKCGTRALLEFLRIHPDVKATGPEPHFFDRYYELGLDWYRDLMPETDGQLTIEKTPRYFVTKEVPERVYNMSRDVRLVLIVRDPVTRAISDYTQVASKRSSMKPFEQMALKNNHTGLIDTSWHVIKIGIYAKHLEEWLRYFPLEQFHFVNGENLVKNPSDEMSKLQDFLGLRRYINHKHFYMNDTRGFPCIQKTGSKFPHCLSVTKGRKHPYVDPDVIKRLQDFYRPFNKKFYQMTKIDFAWP